MRRPTIIDVARRAGVSKSTVSLVLQGSVQVADRTRGQVQAALAEIGYVYNRNAANLRSSNVGLIGLVINDLRNPFFTEFATSAQMALSARGYATVIANTDEDPGVQAQVVRSMIEQGVSALLISPAYGATALGETGAFEAMARAGLPVVQVLRRVDARGDLFPFAAPDYARGGRLATEHVLQRGARRVAFIGGPPGRAVTAERMSGYSAVMAGAGLPVEVIEGRSSRAFGRGAVSGLRASGVEAVVCFNDLVALGLLSGCAEAGVVVGRDLLVTGFDDIEDCAQVWPQLTSVHCDIAGFGAGMAQTLLAWLEGGARPPPESRSPVRLIARHSTLGR